MYERLRHRGWGRGGISQIYDQFVSADRGFRLNLQFIASRNNQETALGACLDDAEWRRAAVLAGKELLSERFNWATTAARLETIYESVRAPQEKPALVS